jgi:hypothetical protein
MRITNGTDRRRVLRPPLLAAFVAVTATGIVIIGYLFNLILA